MEKWNAYTREGKLTEHVLIRDEPIPKGLYHIVCEVLVRHTDGSFLCMKRSMSKSMYAGYYEATAGGSALLGEDKYDCVKRELEEETGIKCDSFTEIGCIIFEKDHAIFYNFICTVSCDKDSVRPQEGETEGYKWFSEEEFIAFVNSGEMIDRQKYRYHDHFVSLGYIKP